MAEKPNKPAELTRLDTLIACADRRLGRAQVRFDRAQQELREAQSDVLRTQMERRTWIEDNSPDQSELKI